MSAYESLLPLHLPSLRRYARALTGDRTQADDLVQDTLERAYVKFHLWQHGSDLRKWLFAIMHNVFINQVKKPHLTLVSMDEIPDRSVHDTDPLLGVDVDRALRTLPDDQREVLLLIVLEGLSYSDVSELLGIPLGTVMSRLSRARDRLGKLMAVSPVAAQEGLK